MYCRSCRSEVKDGTLICSICGSDPSKSPIKKSPAFDKIKILFAVILLGWTIHYTLITKNYISYFNNSYVAEEIDGGDYVLQDDGTFVASGEALIPKVNLAVTSGSDSKNNKIILSINEAIGYYNNGEFLDAADLFEKIYEEESGFEDLNVKLSLCYFGEAKKEYNENNLESAIYYIEKALFYYEKPEYYRSLSHINISLKRYDEAIENFNILEENFSDNGLTQQDKNLLGKIYNAQAATYYNNGNADMALENMEKSIALNPYDSKVKNKYNEIKSQADNEKNFNSTESGMFNVKYEGGIDDVNGYIVLSVLDEAYFSIGSELNFYPKNKTAVVLYSKENFFDITKSPKWSGAIYDGRIKVPLGGINDKHTRLVEVLRHEYSHALIHELSKGKAPMWLNEGLAQYFEGKEVSDYGAFKNRFKKRKNFKFKSLESSFIGLGKSSANNAYFLSLAAVEYIIDSQGGVYKMKSMLKSLGEGNSIEKVLNSELYLSYDKFSEKVINGL